MEPSACAQSCPSNHTSNAAGEHCHWEVSDNVRLRRFLCYGSEGDVYTASEEAHLGMAQAGALLSMLQEGRGIEAVNEIKRFAQDGRAVRLDPSIFALALCSQHAEVTTKRAAFKAVKDICQDPAHLFSFIQYKKELKEDMKCGIWGRALRKAVSDWYNGQDALSLAAVVTRCKQREGWSHKDVLRLSHTKPADEALALISKYVAKGWKEVHVAYADKENTEEVVKVLLYLEVVEKVKHSCDETEVINLIEEHKLEREQLLTDHLKSKLVWRALLKEMPLQSVLWMLGKMTARKIVQPGASETQALCERMQTEAALKKAKLHPFSILLASEHYKRGQGYQGKTKWAADGSILKALDIAFYKSFSNIEPVGKSFVVAVDVSTSLSSVVPGTALSTAVAAAVITMVFARTEADTHVLAYSEGALELCSVSADMTLAQTTDELVKIPGGSTDCTLPIAWATDNGKAVDVFIILTNNPLWTFTASPVETLKKYRQTSGRHSKLVMCGLTSIGHTMPDTGDRGLLSICGFDLGAFRIIRNLAQNLI
ncbi:RNA-binding protein RO60 isoform X1 [Hippocampus comes]|uniref:RNA-binding protein RO60 isoform X1 n=1 Tax=Hippocampus comes TaxID=109280 RepID=UPI00094EF33F|nr:PREDICTED: 60 kDa SS-A/Ro ribonucleoprotein isoform X1 [Hippocampus comes]XP_019734728.1 PREDICTED: 60 kDa SS-A/Ro ribonucleoprotein isoform X1 [Hippocampus comes]